MQNKLVVFFALFCSYLYSNDKSKLTDLPFFSNISATNSSVCLGKSTTLNITCQVNREVNQTGNLSSNSTYTAVSASFPGSLSYSQVLDGSATITVTVNSLPTATISGTQSVCEGSDVTLTITGTPNATVSYRIDSGHPISVNLGASGSSDIVINNIQNTTTYTLISATSDLGYLQNILNQSATITVNKFVNPVINASSLTVCNGSSGNFVITPNAANALATLTYNIDGGANQTIVLDASGTATIITGSLTQNGTINLLRLQTAVDCAKDLTNVSFPITVISLPQMTSFTISNDKVCSGGISTVTIEGTPNATVVYNDGAANNTVVLDESGVGSIFLNNIISNITLNFISIYNRCQQTINQKIEISITDCLSIEESLYGKYSISIHPNPATNQLNLTHTEPIEKASIYNYLGQLVLSQNGAENTMQLNVGNLSNGSYLVKIESEMDTQTVKFVKE